MSRYKLYYKLQLSMLDSFLEKDKLDELLSVLGKSIEGYQVYLQELAKDYDKDDDDFDFEEIAEKSQRIEDLLGTSFVVIQTSITHIVSKIIKMHEWAKNKEGIVLDAKFVDKAKLISLCCTKVEYTLAKAIRDNYTATEELLKVIEPENPTNPQQYTTIELLDSAANLFKHESEWGGSWKRYLENPRAHKKTVHCVSSVGCYNGSPSNFKLIFQALTGTNHFHELNNFSDIIIDWKGKLVAEFKEELKSKNLI